MKHLKLLQLMVLLLLGILSGCATTGVENPVSPTEALQKPVQELEESQLLNVDILLFDPGTLPDKEALSRGLSMEIREAEARYIPMHLRGVMEKTGYWGAVRLVPEQREGYELLLKGEIGSSDGEILQLDITALDASGRTWFDRRYKTSVNATHHQSLAPGEESFTSVYHQIANDLAVFRAKLTDEQRIEIRRIAEMRFAKEMAPDAFDGHLQLEDPGRYTLLRLPAEDDPAFQRVELIRERDFLLIDTLNGHYENFYLDMRQPYDEWRKARSIESEALREVKRKANTSKALGIAAILAAIAIEATGSSQTRASTGTMRDVMVIGGLYGIKHGMDINAQSTIHEEEINELGASFGSEAEPMVIEVDGEIHKLTGSAEDQYAQWRKLIKEIYATETGLLPVPRDLPSENSDQQSSQP